MCCFAFGAVNILLCTPHDALYSYQWRGLSVTIQMCMEKKKKKENKDKIMISNTLGSICTNLAVGLFFCVFPALCLV